MKKEKRFEIIGKEGGALNGAFVIKDSKTGVSYLFYVSGYAGGLTPLLDKDGKPIIE